MNLKANALKRKKSELKANRVTSEEKTSYSKSNGKDKEIIVI